MTLKCWQFEIKFGFCKDIPVRRQMYSGSQFLYRITTNILTTVCEDIPVRRQMYSGSQFLYRITTNILTTVCNTRSLVTFKVPKTVH
jgi:hypothetical protein